MRDPRDIPKLPKSIEERDQLMARIYGADVWARHLTNRKRLARRLRNDFSEPVERVVEAPKFMSFWKGTAR